MKLNSHLEDLYGSADHPVTEPFTLPSSNFDQAQGAGAHMISANRNHEDEILGGAHRSDIIHSNFVEHDDMTSSAPENLIRWFDDNYAGVRFYLVTAPLRSKVQLHTFAAITGTIRRPFWGVSPYDGDFTAQAIELVNDLFALGGIKFVYCNAYALQVRKLPDASWDTLHDRVVNLLDASLFEGKADIGQLTLPPVEIPECWKHLSLEKFSGL